MGKIAAQPAFVNVFGGIKLGKTCDVLYSFPNAIYIAAPGALKAAVGVCGYEPPDNHLFDVTWLKDAVDIVEKTKNDKSIDAIVVDDVSLYVDLTVVKLKGMGAGGYDLWGAVHGQVLALREAGRRCGRHVVFTCHERQPKLENGTKYPGALALPGEKLPYSVPASADIVVRAVPVGDSGANELGWPVVYRCNPNDPEWRTGDRHNVTPDRAPMNLAEILRLYGRVGGNPNFAPRRLAAMTPWAEPMIEKTAQAILAQPDGVENTDGAREFLKALYAAAIRKHGASKPHAAWAVRDAWDRAVLLNAYDKKHTALFGF